MRLRQDEMTNIERIDALLNYKKPDRVPIGMMATGFNTVNSGYTVGDAYRDSEKSFQTMQWAAEQYGWDHIPQYSGHVLVGAWDFGGEVRLPEGEYEGAIVVESHPAPNEADIDQLSLPDVKTVGRVPEAMIFSQLQYQHNIPVFFFTRSPFSLAANICGLDKFLRWSIKKPELCHKLLQLACDHIFNGLAYWVETFGADQIFAWMSSPSESNQLISPKIMANFALPYHQKYHYNLRDLGIKRFGFHVCGEQNLNLPILSEASPWQHPSVLSFGHEVDLQVAAEHFPKDIIFGNIEPAIIQTGNANQVYELCKTAISKGKHFEGGFILGPGCGLPVKAPAANIYAMTKAVHEFGWYD